MLFANPSTSALACVTDYRNKQNKSANLILDSKDSYKKKCSKFLTTFLFDMLISPHFSLVILKGPLGPLSETEVSAVSQVD